MLLISASLLLTALVLVVFWIYLCWGITGCGWRFIAGHLALQATVLTFLLMSVLSNPAASVLWALFPPLSWLLLVDRLADTWAFWSRVLPFALISSALLSLPIISCRPLRLWVPSILIILAVCLGYWRAETVSKAAICASAYKARAVSVRRNSVLWSLRNAPTEFQFGLHGEAMINGHRHGWSYGEMDWYRIPETVYANVRPPEISCDRMVF